MSRAHKAYRQAMAIWSGWIAVHLAALFTMALLLEPGMDASRSAAERAAYIAGHPWRWRLGWVPWQLSALIDIAMSIALCRWLAARGGRAVGWAYAGLALTALAVVPDQWGEWRMITDQLAAATAGDLAAYVAIERWTLLLTGTYGSSGYLLMIGAWMLALAGARPGEAATGVMAKLGIAAMVPFIASALVITRAVQTPALEGMQLLVALNGIAFAVLMLWSLSVAVVMGRIHRGDHPASDAALQRGRWPRRGWFAPLLDALFEPGLRDVLRPLPFVELRSDIRDVVYLNWMVPCERVERLLPAPLALRRFGDRTPLSILSYRHGGFGPALSGPLRKRLPSPLQSNWRLYLEGQDAIYFVKTVLSSAVHVIGSRWLADGLPAHLPLRFEHRREGRRIETHIVPGDSNAPDLQVAVVEQDQWTLPPQFAERFADREAAIAYLVRQNGAVSSQPALGAVIGSAIDIPIDEASVRPAAVDGAVHSAWLAELVEGCEVLAFVVPEVPFRALGEHEMAAS